MLVRAVLVPKVSHVIIVGSNAVTNVAQLIFFGPHVVDNLVIKFKGTSLRVCRTSILFAIAPLRILRSFDIIVDGVRSSIPVCDVFKWNPFVRFMLKAVAMIKPF